MRAAGHDLVHVQETSLRMTCLPCKSPLTPPFIKILLAKLAVSGMSLLAWRRCSRLRSTTRACRMPDRVLPLGSPPPGGGHGAYTRCAPIDPRGHLPCRDGDLSRGPAHDAPPRGPGAPVKDPPTVPLCVLPWGNRPSLLPAGLSSPSGPVLQGARIATPPRMSGAALLAICRGAPARGPRL